jgi:hypothetical protein
MHTEGNKPETYAEIVDAQEVGTVGADDKHPPMHLHASVRVPHIACVAMSVLVSRCHHDEVLSWYYGSINNIVYIYFYL